MYVYTNVDILILFYAFEVVYANVTAVYIYIYNTCGHQRISACTYSSRHFVCVGRGVMMM